MPYAAVTRWCGMAGERGGGARVEMASYRSTYHHGDARAALTQAALDLARLGGPRMVTLRAAARDVGITATAVYRHFATAEELLDAVKIRALRMLADRIDGVEPRIAAGGDRAAVSAAQLHAVAEGYLAFARECPGLFGMACHGGVDAVRDLMAGRLAARPSPAAAGGAPDPAPRPGAGLAVWSVVHGVAVLVVDGSLRAVPEDEQRACLAQVLDIVLAGVEHLAAAAREDPDGAAAPRQGSGAPPAAAPRDGASSAATPPRGAPV
jgi:AcrR family transcriptional regulator